MTLESGPNRVRAASHSSRGKSRRTPCANGLIDSGQVTLGRPLKSQTADISLSLCNPNLILRAHVVYDEPVNSGILLGFLSMAVPLTMAYDPNLQMLMAAYPCLNSPSAVSRLPDILSLNF